MSLYLENESVCYQSSNGVNIDRGLSLHISFTIYHTNCIQEVLYSSPHQIILLFWYTRGLAVYPSGIRVKREREYPQAWRCLNVRRVRLPLSLFLEPPPDLDLLPLPDLLPLREPDLELLLDDLLLPPLLQIEAGGTIQ